MNVDEEVGFYNYDSFRFYRITSKKDSFVSFFIFFRLECKWNTNTRTTIPVNLTKLLIPIPVKMTGSCQSVKGSCNLFIEP